MLEPCIHQAAGLQRLALQRAPRLIAVSSHGDQQGELPLLWGLCTAWVEMGFPVVVLDGHTLESTSNPGLEQLLNGGLGDEGEPASWSVVPAARGFEKLNSTGFAPSELGELFQNFGVVLIYTDAGTMTGLFKGSTVAPLLVVSPLKASSVSAYRALKHLLLNAQLQPTVANIALMSNARALHRMTSPAQHLQHCAMTFLGYAVKALTVTASARAESSQEEINRLALQLLENAVLLERHPAERAH